MKMLILNYIGDFLIRKFFYLIFFTLFNYIYSLEFLGSISLFVFRESFLVMMLLLVDRYRNELALMNKEEDYIAETLYKDYPILKYRLAIGLVALVLWIFLLTLKVESEQLPDFVLLLLQLLGMLTCIFLVLTAFHISAVFNNPNTSNYYNIRKAIKYNGLRSFSTASTVYHICKVCTKGGLAIVTCDVVLPMLTDGNLGARGFLVNYASKNLRPYGVGARTHPIMDEGCYMLDCNPDARDDIVGKDNMLQPHKFPAAYKKYDILPRGATIQADINHKFSMPSIYSWNWGRK